MRVTGWSEATGPAGGFQAAPHSSARSGNARQAGGFHPSPVTGASTRAAGGVNPRAGAALLPGHLQLFSPRSHPRGRAAGGSRGHRCRLLRTGAWSERWWTRSIAQHRTAPHSAAFPGLGMRGLWHGGERRGEVAVVVVMMRRRGGGREAVGVFWGIYNRPFQVQICIAHLNLYSEEKALMKLADDFDAN